jgi:hypothetical protein
MVFVMLIVLPPVYVHKLHFLTKRNSIKLPISLWTLGKIFVINSSLNFSHLHEGNKGGKKLFNIEKYLIGHRNNMLSKEKELEHT